MEIESTYCTNMATVAVTEQAKPLDGPSVTLTIRLIMQGKVSFALFSLLLNKSSIFWLRIKNLFHFYFQNEFSAYYECYMNSTESALLL